MKRVLQALSLVPLTALAAGDAWEFVEVGHSGVLGLSTIIVSPTLALVFNRATNDVLQVNNHSAWGALWNLETNKPLALDVLTDSFCGSGALLSNGTMVSTSGHIPNTPEAPQPTVPEGAGTSAIRIFEPCSDPSGAGCLLYENPKTHKLGEKRWYPSSIRIFDGSLMIMGGSHDGTPFYNTDPANTIEFFPPKDGGVPRPSPFLVRSLPANLYPRIFPLPDGKIFVVANNRSMIYDVETNTETMLPDIPNGVRVTNPFDSSATLLPLHPPEYIPEVLICGGSQTDDVTPPLERSAQDPATDQCSRITLTPAGIRRGWTVERMLERRTMPELLLLPSGQVLIAGGAKTGYAAVKSVGTTVGNSNADHPVYRPSLYNPAAPRGRRFSNTGMPKSKIARMYHSSATFTPQGNVLLLGSNPNNLVQFDQKYSSEYRVENLNPPRYGSDSRPKITQAPKRVDFNARVTLTVSVPARARDNLRVALMDLGFSTHAFHSGQRLIYLDATLAKDGKTLRITTPPNNRVFPPGPGYLYLVSGDSWGPGTEVMVGSGASPPVADQGNLAP